MEKFAGRFIGEADRLVTGMQAQRRLEKRTMSAVNARMEKQKCRVLQTFSDISIFITLILNEYSGLFPVYPAERI
jgi:hypothetical protein